MMVRTFLSKKWVQTILLVLAAVLMLLFYTSCGTQPAAAPATPEPAETPEPTPEPTPVPTPESTPEPTPEPTPAPPAVDITSWEFTLANSYNSITEFRPEHGSILGFTVDYGEADARAQDDAIALLDAAAAAGFALHYDEIYICYEWAEVRYKNSVPVYGSAVETAKHVAGPGVGDHQTALGFDIVERYSYGYDAVSEEAFDWLLANCADYGFILRYPEGKELYYGNACPCHAHFRYVGREAARYIMENGLCLEEFIRLYDPSLVYVPALD